MDKMLFKSASSTPAPADTVNKAGGVAYSLTPHEALAQLVATGTFGQTYYADGQDQIDLMLAAAAQCDPEFVAKAAVYGREFGSMKDAPAFLVAYLSTVDSKRMRQAFPLVIDNARMLRNFVQAIRSGQLGRKSLGTAPRALVREWLEHRSPMQLFRDSVGNDPSIVDCIKLAHPKLGEPANTVYQYLAGKEFDYALLPMPIKMFEALKRGEWHHEVLEAAKGVPSRMLQGLDLPPEAWAHIAKNARWMETRMNLNSFAKHGVFDNEELTKLLAKRLADPDEVRGARAFPYQLLTAYLNVNDDVPFKVREALQDAMEVATENVPEIPGKVFICVDTSGSMGQSITGYRGRGASSKTRCVDVAALFAAALFRKNPEAQIIPFDTRVHPYRPNPRDSVISIAQRLPRMGGGTALSVAMQEVAKADKVDAVIFVSDNESWADRGSRFYYGTLGHLVPAPTSFAESWTAIRRRNKRAKLVCIDLVPNTHTQAEKRENTLNVGGFSDAVFDVVAAFLNEEHNFVERVEAVEL